MHLSAFAALYLVLTALPSEPIPMAPDSTVSGILLEQSSRLADGSPFDCYAIESNRDEPLSLTLSSTAFEGRLWISRGGQCQTARLQHDSGSALQGAVVSVDFTPSGGRYLVIVRPRGQQGLGRYSLTLKGGAAIQSTVPQTPLSSQDRRALMTAQLRGREAQVAAEAAQREEQAQRARLAALEQQQAEAYARARREQESANRWNTFNAILGGLASGYASESQRIQQDSYNQQAFLNNLQRQANEIDRQRQATEQARARALEAQRETQRLHRGEAGRGASSDRAPSDPAPSGRHSEPTQTEQNEARAREEEARKREADRRESEQRQIQQAEERRLAEAARQQEAQRRAAEQRTRMINTPASLSPKPNIGQLGSEWTPWFAYATHNGVLISWRARRYDRESLSIQWQCDNRSGERRYCSINDKAYTCLSGNTPTSSGGGISEASDVGVGRQYSFVSEIACRGASLTFVLPDARVLATPPQ